MTDAELRNFLDLGGIAHSFADEVRDRLDRIDAARALAEEHWYGSRGHCECLGCDMLRALDGTE